MSIRNITYCIKDSYGELIALGNQKAQWSPRTIEDIILDIEMRIHSYFVRLGFIQIKITIANGVQQGKYLTTDPSIADTNLLSDLPELDGLSK